MKAGVDQSPGKVPGKTPAKPSKGPWIFFGISLLLLLISLFTDYDRGLQAWHYLLHLLKTMVPVLMLVFVLMVLINLFLKTSVLIKHMGENSGIKGKMIAIVAGILSVGAVYMWYPMLKEMADRGVRPGLIATFLYNRGIKLQWLPVLALYFSFRYIAVLTLVMIAASLFQGFLMERLLKRSNASPDDRG